MKLLCGVVVVGAVLLAVAEVGAISLYDVVSTTRLMLLFKALIFHVKVQVLGIDCDNDSSSCYEFNKLLIIS